MKDNEIDDLADLQRVLDYQFRNEGLLDIALTHKSYVNELNREDLRNNERFEFLGDSVLGLVICDYLFRNFQEESEGFLSKLKGFIVSKTFIFEVAKELNLGKYLRLGRGEDNSGGRFKRSLLVDSFEAIIASVYLDGGLENAYRFIMRHMGQKIIELANHAFVPDYKTIFQEYTQTEFGCIPTYKVISENGMDHEPEFEISIFIENKWCGKGRGKSKREAEQNAAYDALINLNVEGIY